MCHSVRERKREKKVGFSSSWQPVVRSCFFFSLFFEQIQQTKQKTKNNFIHLRRLQQYRHSPAISRKSSFHIYYVQVMVVCEARILLISLISVLFLFWSPNSTTDVTPNYTQSNVSVRCVCPQYFSTGFRISIVCEFTSMFTVR